MYIREIKEVIIPKNVANFRGTVLYPTNPSIAYFVKLLNDQVLLPNFLSSTSYGIKCVLKPTQENSPLEKKAKY